jgi:hypothetical protein
MSPDPIYQGKQRIKRPSNERHMDHKQIDEINLTSACPHLAPIFRNRITGAIFKGDCGDRQHCLGARNRFRREFESRLAALTLEPKRPLFLWTFTASSLKLNQTEANVQKPDPGDPKYRANWQTLVNGLARVEHHVLRRAAKERRASYSGPKLVKTNPGSRLAIVWVREVGEDGRAHLHTLSDIEFIDHTWLTDICISNGLGFSEFRPIDKLQLRGGRVPAEIASYLSKFAPDNRWPFPKGVRLYGAARGRLPKLSPHRGFERYPWKDELKQVSNGALTLVHDDPLSLDK